jgi:hypothetical protein
MIMIADDIAPMPGRQVEVSMYHAMQQRFSGRRSCLRDPLLCCRNRLNFVTDEQCVCMQPPTYVARLDGYAFRNIRTLPSPRLRD